MDTQKKEWDDSCRNRDNFVSHPHEHGTVQSYFNFAKIRELFDIEDALLMRRENVIVGGYSSLYHLAVRKKDS